MKELVALAAALGPDAINALVDLVKLAVRGASADTVAREAEKLAHCIAYEKALKAARRG